MNKRLKISASYRQLSGREYMVYTTIYYVNEINQTMKYYEIIKAEEKTVELNSIPEVYRNTYFFTIEKDLIEDELYSLETIDNVILYEYNCKLH
ncbi:hypothetical protein O0550_13305 [Brevibacillus halotolerans]|uniref:hypothetical protein n=1 Tax=Brevibacillus TaxID=55080 RepID=UPI00215BDEAD|nr:MULTISPECIES: hypothetical protein [Brevibacillus]MCR8964173.1 hypothetical protein [Brevibacillus laterosporus]MCZ0836328.1 hypothetical protein [Brevibacillus halotolerans]